MTLFDGKQSQDRLLTAARRSPDADIRLGLEHGTELRQRLTSQGQHDLAAEVHAVLMVLARVRDERVAMGRWVDDAVSPVKVLKDAEIYSHGGSFWSDDPLR